MRMNRIYTCGKMSGVSLLDQLNWRLELEDSIRNVAEYPVDFIHPPKYYNYDHKFHKSEREVKEFELAKVRECDILVVNLDEINSSVGAHFEIAYADSVNSFGDKHIFIIGIGDDSNIHPWIRESIHRVEDTIDDAADYIVTYLLK